MWLRNIKDVYRLPPRTGCHHRGRTKADRLVELNVQEQIFNLAKTSIIQRAWKNEQRPAPAWVGVWAERWIDQTGLRNECRYPY